MSEKKKAIIITLLSAIVFCALIIAASLSPLSEMGENANQFNSLGMWLAIAIILTFYIVPLALYVFGPKWMKIIMAILCATGIVVFLSTIVAVVIIGIINDMLTTLISVIMICGLGIIVNTVWFFVAFSKKY